MSKTEDITLDLIDKGRQGPQDLKGRNITTDNLYTSVPLANKLLDRGMTLVGTMRHNRVGLPKEVKSLEGRKEYDTQVWWEVERQKQHSLHIQYQPKAKN